MARALGLSRESTGALKKALSKLVRAGELEHSTAGYRVPRGDGLVEGIFEVAGRGRRGGSIVREEGGRSWKVMGSAGAPLAQNGDRVLLQPIVEDGPGCGEIVSILEGSRDHWVGIFRRRSSSAVVTPYRDAADWTVRVAARDAGTAKDGDVVVAEPIGTDRHRPNREGRAAGPGVPKGRITAVLGRPGDAEADFRAVAWRHRLPIAFPETVLAQADAIPGTLDRAEIARRVDLRGRTFITIDPASARDFDDAISTEHQDDGAIRLWVAIADVSHYVPEFSALDTEALRRGNSVYFPDRAIPMLPERLSGDLCSLRPDRDRFVSVVELVFDKAASLTRRSFYPAVIRSRARLVYAEAAGWMEEGDSENVGAVGPGVTREVAEQLRTLWGLTERLGRRRRKAGSIDFELPEPRIEIDADGVVIDVAPATRTRAHRAVEEAMLAANRAVAEALVAAECSAIFRIHEPPEARDAAELRALFEASGLLPSDGRRELSGRDIASALALVRGKPEERLVNQVALRSLRQACYSAESRGHFALAFPHYVHFTSPIRRYADLVVHRAVARALHGERSAPGASLRPAVARRIAARISWRERVAMEAERERAKLACCAVMAPRVGQDFEGTVTGVARHGLYVTLDTPYVEGLIHISRFREVLEFDERARSLRARRSGARYGLGDRLQLTLDSVDPVELRIDFTLRTPKPARPRVPHPSARTKPSPG